MTGLRRALLLATDKYEQATPLQCCVQDAQALQAVLADRDIGAFVDVELLADFHLDAFRYAVSSYLTSCQPDDVVLLFIGGHMGLDDSGDLHILAADTSVSNLHGTTISGRWLMDKLDECRSKRVLLILDGCHSGSIGGVRTDLNNFDAANAAGLAGRGRVVLASAGAAGVAHALRSSDEPRSFTDILVRGLSSGAADVDNDGLVSVFELFEYGYNETVKHFGGEQRPTMRMFGGTPASITVAYVRGRHAIGVTAHGTTGLSSVLRAGIRSDLERERAQAIWRLFALVDSDDPPTRSQALLALFEMSQDPNPEIRQWVRWRLTAGNRWWRSGQLQRDRFAGALGNAVVDWYRVAQDFRGFPKVEINLMGDYYVQSAGRDLKGSAAGRNNKIGYSEVSVSPPQTIEDLKTAIEKLADEVNAADLSTREKASVLPALLWWSENIGLAEEPPEAKEHAWSIRRAGEWIWKRLVDLVDAAPAAMVAAWAFEMLKHSM